MFLTSQKNLLYKAIQEKGLTQRDFKLESSDKLKLIHLPTNFYFRIEVQNVVVYTNGVTEPRLFTFSTPKHISIGINTKEETEHQNIKDWPTIVAVLNQWLSWLKLEASEPDLWAEMEQQPFMFANETSMTDENFTADEIKLLSERVAEVEQRVTNLNLPPGPQIVIVELIRNVPNKAKRLTKQEVVNEFAGGLVREGFKWKLSTQEMDDVWHSFQFFFLKLIS